MTDNKIKTYSTRYLGSKVKLLDWIWEEITPYIQQRNINSIADAFAGTGVVSYLFKQKGLNVISNDFLLFNSHIHKSIIENNKEVLTEDDIFKLLNPQECTRHFIETEYTDLFFPLEDTQFLDKVFFEIQKLDSEEKKSLAFACICQAILKKAPYGRFTTTKMTNIGVRTIKEYFITLINEYNYLVIDNNTECKSFNLDALEFVKDLNVDAIYFDPPYGGKSFSKYEHFYNFVEVYANYWEEEEKVGKLKQVKKKESPFSYGKKHKEVFNELFVNSSNIPLWIFSYNDNAGMSIDELTEILSTYKENIVIKEKPYEYANKLRTYNEYLIFAY